ncbi:MAG: FMN-binding protein [Candidatus Omnitrophota bacterium]
MKEMVRYGLILSLICAAASASLAAMNSVTKPKIIAQAKAEEEASLKEVLPLAERFEPVKSGEDVVYYKAYAKDGKFAGAAFKAYGKGYSSVVETMTGLLPDGSISAIKIVNQNETPGLGANVIEPSFTGQFSHKNIPALQDVQAITGATISSKAVIDSVSKRAQEIKELIKNEK